MSPRTSPALRPSFPFSKTIAAATLSRNSQFRECCVRLSWRVQLDKALRLQLLGTVAPELGSLQNGCFDSRVELNNEGVRRRRFMRTEWK